MPDALESAAGGHTTNNTVGGGRTASPARLRSENPRPANTTCLRCKHTGQTSLPFVSHLPHLQNPHTQRPAAQTQPACCTHMLGFRPPHCLLPVPALGIRPAAQHALAMPIYTRAHSVAAATTQPCLEGYEGLVERSCKRQVKGQPQRHVHPGAASSAGPESPPASIATGTPLYDPQTSDQPRLELLPSPDATTPVLNKGTGVRHRHRHSMRRPHARRSAAPRARPWWGPSMGMFMGAWSAAMASFAIFWDVRNAKCLSAASMPALICRPPAAR